MTILGQHTIAETRDLIRTLEFRINKNLRQYELIRSLRMLPKTRVQADLDRDVAAFANRWIIVRDRQTLLMAASIVSNPKVSPLIIPAETNFQAIDKATRLDNPRLIEIQQRINAEAIDLSLPAVDLKGIPPQGSPDADFVALKKLDAAIAAGEETAKRATTEIGKAAKSNVGLLVGLGVVGVLGVVVATKVYL